MMADKPVDPREVLAGLILTEYPALIVPDGPVTLDELKEDAMLHNDGDGLYDFVRIELCIELCEVTEGEGDVAVVKASALKTVDTAIGELQSLRDGIESGM